MNDLNKLRALTQNLPPFPEALHEVSSSLCSFSCEEYPMDQGTCVAWNLINQPEIAAARWLNTKGSVFPEHAHQEREWILIYKGSMHLNVGDDCHNLRVGDYFVLDPATKHSAEFEEDCWYLAVTIPASKDWPK